MSGAAPTDRVITLWWTSILSNASNLEAVVDRLEAAERRRAARFRVDAGRLRFIAAHAMLRTLLAHRLGVLPDALRFVEGPRGKPTLSEPPAHPEPRFNLSHSGDLAVVALADTEIGVDVEAHRPVPKLDALARRFFSEAERDRLASVAEEKRETLFLGIWTAKEAYLKAVGSGVAMSLRQLEIDPDGPAIERIAGDPHVAGQWTLLGVTLPGPAVCTVAVRGRGWRLDAREFDWSYPETGMT